VLTIWLPQWVKTAREMPSISHHVSCARIETPDDGFLSRSNDARSIVYVERHAASSGRELPAAFRP
jgi:hypothetical protein